MLIIAHKFNETHETLNKSKNLASKFKIRKPNFRFINTNQHSILNPQHATTFTTTPYKQILTPIFNVKHQTKNSKLNPNTQEILAKH
eukprot:gene13071-8917_t